VNFFIPSSVVIIPALFVWIVTTSLLLYARRIDWTLLRYTVLTGFVTYLLLLVHLIVFPIHVRTGSARDNAHFRSAVNIIPFDDLRAVDFMLNIAVTIPLGFMLPIALRRSFSIVQIAIIAAIVGGGFEFNQYLMRKFIANDRFVDINDVIANSAGVLVGFLLLLAAKQDRSLRHWAVANLMR
jgi:glycopeptide antibiotics resistance protein